MDDVSIFTATAKRGVALHNHTTHGSAFPNANNNIVTTYQQHVNYYSMWIQVIAQPITQPAAKARWLTIERCRGRLNASLILNIVIISKTLVYVRYFTLWHYRLSMYFSSHASLLVYLIACAFGLLCFIRCFLVKLYILFNRLISTDIRRLNKIDGEERCI